MKNPILIISTLVLFLCTGHLQAKDDPYKFGKISPTNLQATVCPIDSSAHAYTIFDKGVTFFSFFNGIQVQYERHFRIKILDKSAFDEATFAIPYYESGNTKEQVMGIKGCTYNWVNGKMQKSPLEKSSIFKENVTKNHYQIKITLPNIQEGSVFEVSYTIKSDRFWDLRDWKFQSDIPCMESTYLVEMPEYFKFNQFQRGYLNIKTKPSSKSQTFPQTSTLFTIQCYDYSATDIPAFPVGEHLTTIENYISKVSYELSSYEVPGQVYKNFTTKWEDVIKSFIDDENFGYQLRADNHLKDAEKEIRAASTDPNIQMQLAFDWVKAKMKWNGNTGCNCTAPLRKTLDNGIGNSADINLNLTALLKRLDIKADPVVLSTRANGFIHPAHPSIDQMNYVVAICRMDNVSYLLDATEKYTDIDILPARCLNGEGLLISDERVMWEPLLKGKKSKSTTLYDLTLDADGKFKGSINFWYSDFKALEERLEVSGYETKDKFIEKLQENNSGLNITDYTIDNLDSVSKDFAIKLNVELTEKTDQTDNLIFFSPMQYDGYTKNPFSLEKREYPVEYPYPIFEKAVINITIPEGYQVESLPATGAFTAIDGNCKFVYRTGAQGNKITILSTIEINQTIIPGTQYAEIKALFEKIVEKHLEKVVLKKI